MEKQHGYDGKERRHDYEEFLETKFKQEIIQKEMTVLNARVEQLESNSANKDDIENIDVRTSHLERVADRFEAMQTSISTIVWLARGIGAFLVFVLTFGDVLKKKIGL